MVDLPENPGAYRLTKSGKVIYVGSAKNLLQRYFDWKNNPENVCVRQNGWDKFVWQPTGSHEQARRLELEWYNKFRPICNLVAPPGTA